MAVWHEVYLLHDNDVDLYKIGRRTTGTPRFKSRSNIRKNGYITDIVQLIQSNPMTLAEVDALEKDLHQQFADFSHHYPPNIVTTANGKVTKQITPNGYTEWFEFDEKQVKEVMSLLSA